MEKFYYFLPSVLKNWLTKPDSDKQEEVVAGATEEEEVAEQEEVVSGAMEEKEEDVVSGATDEEDEEVASGATDEEEEEVVSGATEEEEVVSGAKDEEEEEVVSGAMDEEEEEVVSGAMDEEEVASGATEEEEEEVASGATEEEEEEVVSGATDEEEEEVASGATDEEEEEVASGATEEEEEEVASGATEEEEEEVVSGATDEEEEEVASGATDEEEEEVASGATEEEEEEVEARATEQAEAVAQITKQVAVVRDFKQNISDKIQQNNLFWNQTETHLKGQNLARQLYHQEEFRCPEIIRQLNEDLELAEVTVKAYVTFFRFTSKSLDKTLRSFLRVFWPEDELEIQHLLITHFSCRYLTCTGQPLSFQPAVYYLSWAMIILNADLNGSHKGRKMTCEEFIANLVSARCNFQYSLKPLKNIYKSIKMKPLQSFRVKTRCQAADKKETSIPEDSCCKSSFETENNPTTTVHKTGNLICKRVTDENGRKTRKCQRAWKPFTAVLKGMVLHLQKDTSDLCEADNKNAIRLHHAMAYPVDYKKRPHVLCLKTADSRLFYFQAESEVEQTSWVAIINRIAARYSAPPLTSASHDIKAHHPQVLPSFPTTLSLEQQLEYHKDQLQRVSEHMDYYLRLPLWDCTLSLDYMEQEVKRYTTYVRALQELVAEEDAGEAAATQICISVSHKEDNNNLQKHT